MNNNQDHTCVPSDSDEKPTVKTLNIDGHHPVAENKMDSKNAIDGVGVRFDIRFDNTNGEIGHFG